MYDCPTRLSLAAYSFNASTNGLDYRSFLSYYRRLVAFLSQSLQHRTRKGVEDGGFAGVPR